MVVGHFDRRLPVNACTLGRYRAQIVINPCVEVAISLHLDHNVLSIVN